MKDAHLEVFVDGVVNYFNTISAKPAQVGTPFLINNINSYLMDFTGIIGISGNQKGSVFFTAPKSLLVHLLRDLGIMSIRDEKLMDLVGEVGNTISGNARREFGDQFLLSVPLVLKGKSDDIAIAKTVEIYVIPIVWRHAKANLIINLES